MSKETIKNWHRPRIDAVLSAGVDALAIETIPCLVSGFSFSDFSIFLRVFYVLQMEAEALIELLCLEYPRAKYWISFQCKVSCRSTRSQSPCDGIRSI